MKKSVCFTLLFCILLFGLFAETFMELGFVKDDFGDPTGEKKITIITDTFTFSNSATIYSEGEAVGFLIFPDSKLIACLAIPYSGVETFIDDKIDIAYKAGNNASKSFIYDSSKYATFELYGTRYDEIINAMKSNSKIQFVVRGTEYEIDTKYNFTFEYDKDEFNKLLSQFK